MSNRQSGTEPRNTPGRSDVVALLQNTPFIFGMTAPGGDTPQLRELTDLAKGDVFPLPEDSSGFDAFVRAALDVTPLPVFDPPELLSKLSIKHARVDWRPRKDHHRHSANSGIELSGKLELPEGTTCDTLGKRSEFDILLARHSLVSGEFLLHEQRRHRHGTRQHHPRHHSHHHATRHRPHGDHKKPDKKLACPAWLGHAKDDPKMKLEIEWHSPRLASYKLAGSFDAQDFDGNAQPHELMLILQLGEPSYSREAVIHHNQWRVRTSWLWLGPNGEDPDVPEGHHPEEASADDSAPGIICAISARPGPLHLGWLAFCMGGIVLGWLRRRHRR